MLSGQLQIGVLETNRPAKCTRQIKLQDKKDIYMVMKILPWHILTTTMQDTTHTTSDNIGLLALKVI